MAKAKTVQVGDKLIIVNGVDPLMYVDLSKKKLHIYEKKRYKVWFKLVDK